jgi:nucleoside-diphosphate-sugar epimerase
MVIFMTGATGVMGRLALPQLLSAGHGVRALARSAANVATLRALGAEPVTGDLGDAAALRGNMASCDVIMHLATKIPPLNQLGHRAAWNETDRLRRDGTRAIVDAALAAGVQTVIYPGICFAYPDSGAAWIDATTRQPVSADYYRTTFDAEAEVARFAASGGRGVSLRMGFFYGPESPQSRSQISYARMGISVVGGPSSAYHPYLAISDAATAVVAALTAPSGVYDIVMDDPPTTAEFNQTLAAVAGRQRLWATPGWLMRLTVGSDIAATNMRSQRVSNRRFKDATGWAPQVDSATGWRAVAEARAAEARA